MTRILIADDHPLYLDGMARVLQQEMECSVDRAQDGQEALLKIRETRPDLGILDIRMPKLGGLKVLEFVQDEQISTKILLLSGYVDPSSVYEALRKGAKGYLVKSCSIETVVDTALKVLRGLVVLPPEIHDDLAQAIISKGDVLTKREKEILTLGTLPTAQIAKRLFISVPTVKVHLSHIYKKLDVENRAAAIQEAMKRGIL